MTRRYRATCPKCIAASEDEKHCHGICDEIKPRDAFHNDKAQADGKLTECKECRNASSLEYKAKRDAEDPRWNYEYQKAWDAAHFDRYARYDTEHRVRNAASVQFWNARWNAENGDRKYELNAVRRARKMEANVHEVVRRPEVAARDEWTCMAEVCYHPDGRAIDPTLPYINPETGRPDPWYLNVDHIEDLNAGGDHSYANVRATHARCNSKRKRGRRRPCG